MVVQTVVEGSGIEVVLRRIVGMLLNLVTVSLLCFICLSLVLLLAGEIIKKQKSIFFSFGDG